MSVTGGAFREPFAGNELLAVFLLPNGRTIPRESSVRTEPCFRMASPTEVRCRLDNLSYCVYYLQTIVNCGDVPRKIRI